MVAAGASTRLAGTSNVKRRPSPWLLTLPAFLPSQVSPFDPWGSTIALAFVLVVCATSELWQDAKRHRGDWVTNSRRTRVMAANGAFRDVAWRDVRVGDVVMVRDDEEVPADLVLLFAALTDRVCYVQTTNLGALSGCLAI